MAGFLDFLSSTDPTDQANLALAAGLLGGTGSFNSVLGKALIGAQAAGNASSDRQTRQMLLKAQMGDIAAQEDLRKQQAARLSASQGLLAQVLGNQGSSSQYGVSGSGVKLGGVSEPMIPQKSGLAGASPEQIAALKANGMDISNIWELAQFGKEMQPGYRRNVGGGVDYYGDPSKGFNVQNGQVSLMPGALEAQSSLAGAQTGAQEAAKAPYSLVPILGPQGEKRQVPLSQFLSMNRPGYSESTLGDKLSAINEDMRRTGVNEAKYNLGGSNFGTVNAPGLKTGLSPSEENKNAADQAYMKDRANAQAKDMSSIQERGFAAPSKIATYNYIGDLLKGYEGGSLSGLAVKAASTANSLGITLDPKLPDKQAAEAIAGQMALTLRSTAGGGGMPGAMSDNDLKFLRSMTPTLAQTAAGRDKIVKAHIAVAQRDADIAQFARNYENKYGQLDNGFYTQLQQWSNDHQLFK